MKKGLLFLVAISFACSGDPGGIPLAQDPYADVPLSGLVRVPGLDGPIDIVRDKFGVPHVYAQSIADATFAEGYAAARDRLPQMNLFRHFASGTISELFGALDRSQIDQDLSFRMHQFRPFAQQSWDMLMASSDPIDKDIVLFVQRYSDGVNQYLSELKAGKYTIDNDIAQFFDPARTEDWTPVDSLTLARLELWSQDYDADTEITSTRIMQAGHDNFGAGSPPDQARRAGLVADLFPVRPLDLTSTVQGFGQHRHAQLGATERPRISPDVMKNAVEAIRPNTKIAKDLRNLFRGSNNWVVQAAGGKAILANDPHLGLSNPPIWWLVHLTVPGKFDVEGVSLPGTPGIVLGHNGHIAWGATDVFHDVTDVYKETVVACTAPQTGWCVMWKGQQVQIQTRQETLRIAALGTGNETLTVTYEVVPHHGPIIPTIQNHKIIDRTAPGEALSVRYTGYEPTFEVRALYKMMQATTVDEGFNAVEDWSFGGLNWVIIDDAGNIGWYPHAHIPWRTTPGCFTYDKVSNPMGVTPFAVLPGDGSCEWEGYMESQYIPRAKNPSAGFIATANADPVGATFDDNAFNDMANGHVMYLNGHYDPGYRVGRITRDIQAVMGSGKPATMDDMGKIQADAHSNYGDDMRPHIIAAIDAMSEEIASPNSHPDLRQFVMGLTAARRDQIVALKPLLQGWSLETPAATEAGASQAEILDSAATSLFNVWVRKFFARAFGDELALLGTSVHDYETPRVGLWVFTRPTELQTPVSNQTQQPLLCDDLTTTNVTESCTFDVLAALDDALTSLHDHFASDAQMDWRWGKLHTLTLGSQLPDHNLDIPPPDDPVFPMGYPRQGDNYAVDACMPGFSGDTYTYDAGPSMRHLTTFAGAGQPVSRMALPGGEVFDRSSPHYRDLMDNYWSQNKYFDLAWTIADIHKVAESRLRLQPVSH